MSAPVDRLLAGLLGPPDPEVGCDRCLDLIDRYAETQVRTGDADLAMPRMTAHLRGCPVCADELDSLVSLIRDAPETPPIS